jgi:hypothetical protein
LVKNQKQLHQNEGKKNQRPKNFLHKHPMKNVMLEESVVQQVHEVHKVTEVQQAPLVHQVTKVQRVMLVRRVTKAQ